MCFSCIRHWVNIRELHIGHYCLSDLEQNLDQEGGVLSHGRYLRQQQDRILVENPILTI